MSNRDSLGFGELIPQDVVDIFAQEKHSTRSRKKRSHSLGRALGWLKGKKRKDLSAKGQSLGLGTALDLAFDGKPAGHQGGHKGGQKSGRQAPQAVQKRSDDDDDRNPATPLFQENVFIEASRPKYLENLHTEALEGLKMMQQEETSNGVEYRDNESTISNMTVHTDGEGGGFMTDSTIADSTSVVSVKSSVSTRSSRSGLTRQESTFRPLNSGKKSKTRRKHRKTVAGIPQHVQRELGLDRVGWTLAQAMNEDQVYDGETDESPVTPGLQLVSQTGASIPVHPLNKEQLDQLAASHAAHGDDLTMLHRLDPNSLQSELSSPVITTSPQAAYMSKIIPNAVLPPSIDVVEISRGRSRNSVRTVSKSSLVMSSPATSRASSRASSTRTTSSKASTITSASQQNPPNMTDSSCWSNSESSETLVSDSSTISSSSTPRQKRSQDGNVSAKEDKVSVHSSLSKASKGTSNGKVISKGKEGSKDGQFVRSLSVMKPKRAPPPPNRSYSLHKMKRRSRDLAEVRVIPVLVVENEKNKPGSSPLPSKPIDSPGYNADTSSLDESAGSASFSPVRSQLNTLKETEAAKADERDSKDAPKEQSKIVSPSSGYSSQDATSTQSLKESHSSSPRHKRGLLAKLQRLFPGSSSSASPPPPASRPQTPGNTKPTQDTSVDAASPSVRALRELFNIPPHPKVHAPPPPPPEVWVHSQRSIELLLGPPVPDNVYAIIKKNPKDRRPHRQSPSASTEGSVKVERKHKTETKKVPESVILNAEVHKENDDRLTAQRVDLKVTEKDEKVRASDILSGLLVKAVVNREERLAAREEEARKSSTQTPEVKSKTDVSLHSPPSSKVTTEVVSPESSWPPPPPPVGQIVITDEMDFPLPPPPMFSGGLVLPVQVPPESSNPGGGSTSLTTPLNIPPPPSYSAPPPPVGPVTPSTVRRPSPLPPIQEVPASPSPIVVSPPLPPPPPPIEVSPPPQPKDITSSPPFKEAIPPPPPVEVPPPAKEESPPPPKEFVLPPLPVEVPPPPPEVTPLQPLKKVTPPPPPIEVILPSPPVEVSPPPPPKEVILLPPPVVVVPPPTEVTPPPPPPPIEVPPPPKEDLSSPPPPKEVSPPPEEVSPPPPPVIGVSTTLVTVKSPPSSQEALPPPVTQVSTLPPTETSSLSTAEASPPSSQETPTGSSGVTPPVSALTPPQSIPPPPPLLTPPQQESDPPQDKVQSEPETSISILAPPESIPPPPPAQLQPVEDNTGSPAPQETSPPPQPEASIPPAPAKAEEAEPLAPANIPLPPPLPSAELQPSPSSTEKQTPEPTYTPVVKEDPSPMITPSLLQMVKLRSVNSSPEPPKAPEQPEEEVTMRKQVTTTTTSSEAPQKPIRRSLIMISPSSPTSTSPPAAVVPQPTLPKTQSLVLPVTSSSTALSPTKKSPPAVSPSMNLQEAIRLRTAARSKENPPSRLSLHSPTSPLDVHKSPSSTASFIFAKSNKRVVIETRPVDVSSVTKVESEAESGKKGVKVPPPVAKKPKTKGKETEANEGTEQTAGQEESNKDGAEKTNGTAGTVE